jgi:phospholipase A1
MKFQTWYFVGLVVGVTSSLLLTSLASAQATSPATAMPGAPVFDSATAPPVANPDPVATDPRHSNSPARHSGFVEFLSDRIAPYEPIYFIAGTERPNAKFQFSLRYQLFNDDGPAAQAFEPLKGINFAFSQTSFWDLSAHSSPFFDNSYRPEVMLHYDDIIPPDRLRVLEHIGLQAGVQHESNGQEGDNSRSVNYVYVRPLLTLGDRDDGAFFVTLAPRFQADFGRQSHNPDLKEFRGYGDLRLIIGQSGGLQAAFIGRIGSNWDKGSIQMDLTFPLRKLSGGNIDLYLNLQVFNGFGESLLDYNESDTSIRLGVSLVR